MLRTYITRHRGGLERYARLLRYYLGDHDIQHRTRSQGAPNNKVVCNHARNITDTVTGYFVGQPITYNGDAIEDLTDWLERAGTDLVDNELAQDMSIYGRAYEIISMDADARARSYCVSPQNALMVYDDTLEHQPLFGVYYYPRIDQEGHADGYACTVYTDTEIHRYALNEGWTLVSQDSQPHYFGAVPMIEYHNGRHCQGDFEPQISLIDAYNLLMSDRINDKEQFVDAILILVNATLQDNMDLLDADDESAESYRRLRALRDNKLLELGEGGDARYLTRTFDEAGIEVLRKALERDIYKFAATPCMSDDNFVGNSSGVAMEYKLLGLEQLIRIKERYFTEGLRRRCRLYAHVLETKGRPHIDVDGIEYQYKRGLPKNLMELAQIVATLDERVPQSYLLSLLPFVHNVDDALKELAAERDARAERQLQSFGIGTPPPVTAQRKDGDEVDDDDPPAE